MLLHIGGFTAAMLPSLLEVLEQRGTELVTLEEAQSDPAYAIDPDLASPWGGTLLQQMMDAKGITPAVAPDDALARLDGLCR